MFGKTSLLGECSATETEERGFLAVVPDNIIGNNTSVGGLAYFLA